MDQNILHFLITNLHLYALFIQMFILSLHIMFSIFYIFIYFNTYNKYFIKYITLPDPGPPDIKITLGLILLNILFYY